MSTISERDSSDYYEILQLPCNGSNTLTNENVKAAYHRALLLHHPDKTNLTAVNASTMLEIPERARYSIDEILRAYQTLSNPVSRAAYNVSRTPVVDKGSGAGVPDKATHIGVEIVDLEELGFDEDIASWYRGCRCGDRRGYVITEADLEKEISQGEVYVGCKGCSLFIKVLFSTVETDEQT